MKPFVLLQPDPPFWTRTAWIQLGYGAWVNMTIVGIGMALGFPAVTVPQLQKSNMVLTTMDEAWIASVLTLSAPLGCIICGIVMDRFGRKIMLVFSGIPLTIGWVYTGCALEAKHIIIGRVICGVGLGMAVSVPRAYNTEITLPNMRGVVGAMTNLAVSVGISIMAGLGSFIKWDSLCYISGAYTTVLSISYMFLPDTPYAILMRSSASDARRALERFRSSKFDIDQELEELKEFKNNNNIRRLTWMEQIRAMFRPSSCKPFGIAIGYIALMQLVGVNVVTVWAVEMLEMSKSSVQPKLGNFILGLTRLGVGVMTSILLYKIGRRVMALTSAIGVGLNFVALGVYLHTTDSSAVFPQLLFIGYMAFATLGYYTLPMLIMFELLPLQLRGSLSGIGLSFVNILMFAMNQCYPLLRNEFGFENTIILYGLISLLGAIYLYFVLPETRNLTLQEIEEYFNSRRPTLVSQRRVLSIQMKEAFKKSAVNDSKTKRFGAFKSKIRIKREDDRKDKELKDHEEKDRNITDDTESSTSKDDKKREKKQNRLDEKETKERDIVKEGKKDKRGSKVMFKDD